MIATHHIPIEVRSPEETRQLRSMVESRRKPVALNHANSRRRSPPSSLDLHPSLPSVNYAPKRRPYPVLVLPLNPSSLPTLVVDQPNGFQAIDRFSDDPKTEADSVSSEEDGGRTRGTRRRLNKNDLEITVQRYRPPVQVVIDREEETTQPLRLNRPRHRSSLTIEEAEVAAARLEEKPDDDVDVTARPRKKTKEPDARVALRDTSSRSSILRQTDRPPSREFPITASDGRSSIGSSLAFSPPQARSPLSSLRELEYAVNKVAGGRKHGSTNRRPASSRSSVASSTSTSSSPDSSSSGSSRSSISSLLSLFTSAGAGEGGTESHHSSEAETSPKQATASTPSPPSACSSAGLSDSSVGSFIGIMPVAILEKAKAKLLRQPPTRPARSASRSTSIGRSSSRGSGSSRASSPVEWDVATFEASAEPVETLAMLDGLDDAPLRSRRVSTRKSLTLLDRNAPPTTQASNRNSATCPARVDPPLRSHTVEEAAVPEPVVKPGRHTLSTPNFAPPRPPKAAARAIAKARLSLA